MPLAAGEATSGKTGALALKSLETGGTLRYIPTGEVTPTLRRGDSVVPLINNVSFASQKVKGLSRATFGFSAPLIPTVMNADFFARAVGAVQGDTDRHNYHQATMYPDDAGSAPDNYNLVKFGMYSGRVVSDTEGAAQIVGLRLDGISIDPYSLLVAPLAAPPAGPLSTGDIMGFAQTAIAELVDGEWDSVSWQIMTGLQIVRGRKLGNNPRFPYLPKGLLMTGLSGTVTVSQIRSAGTVIGDDGSDGSLTMNFGAAGAGLSQVMKVMPVGGAEPSTQSVNYVTRQYLLKSPDGSNPLAFANL